MAFIYTTEKKKKIILVKCVCNAYNNLWVMMTCIFGEREYFFKMQNKFMKSIFHKYQ